MPHARWRRLRGGSLQIPPGAPFGPSDRCCRVAVPTSHFVAATEMLVGLLRAPCAAPRRQLGAPPRGNHRIATPRMQGAPIAAARSGQASVAESLHLLQFPADTPEVHAAPGAWH